MSVDIWTVVWKESQEMFRGPGARFNTAVMIGTVGLIGILMPMQQGAGFVASPVTLLYCLWVPMTIVPSIVADSFAGERERHTLETLLAGRLSDRAILFGKVCAVVLYALGLTMICLLLGLIGTNLTAGKGRLLVFPAWLALGSVATSLLGSWLYAGLGVLVSLRAPTVQKAQQVLALATLLPVVPFVALILVLGDARFGALLMRAGSLMQGHAPVVVGAAILVLLLGDVALAWISLARFQRARLILD